MQTTLVSGIRNGGIISDIMKKWIQAAFLTSMFEMSSGSFVLTTVACKPATKPEPQKGPEDPYEAKETFEARLGNSAPGGMDGHPDLAQTTLVSDIRTGGIISDITKRRIKAAILSVLFGASIGSFALSTAACKPTTETEPTQEDPYETIVLRPEFPDWIRNRNVNIRKTKGLNIDAGLDAFRGGVGAWLADWFPDANVLVGNPVKFIIEDVGATPTYVSGVFHFPLAWLMTHDSGDVLDWLDSQSPISLVKHNSVQDAANQMFASRQKFAGIASI